MDSVNLAVSVLAVCVSLIAYRAAAWQNRLTASSVAADWLRDLRSWASEAVDALAESGYSYSKKEGMSRAESSEFRERCRYRLSALIDRGRFLLPNEREDEYGSHKARAYRGLRHPALDALVAAEMILAGTMPLDVFPDEATAIVGLRREFVSLVQSIIDPQSYNRHVARILRAASEARSNDPTLGGLLPDASKLPTGAKGMMDTVSKRYEASLR